MIKKGKKCLALILSAAAVSSFMGNFGAVAMDPSPAAAAAASAPRGSAWSNPLALQALRHQSDTGITEEDLEKPWVRHAFEIYGNLMKQKLKYSEAAGKRLEELGKDCKSLCELYKLDTSRSVRRAGKGICRTFAHRVIYEFLEKSKKVEERVEIYPLVLDSGSGRSHMVDVFIVDGKKYVMDITNALTPSCKFPHIFTLESYLKYYNSHCFKINKCAVVFEDVSTFEKPLEYSFSVCLDPNTGKRCGLLVHEGRETVDKIQKLLEAVKIWNEV